MIRCAVAMLAVLASEAAWARPTARLTDFGGANAARFARAADWCRGNPGGLLVIPPGDYVVRDACAQAVAADVLSGRYGRDPQTKMFRADFPFSTVLDLSGTTNVTVLADGARIVLDGFGEFLAARCAVGLTVRGLELGHLRLPFSRGRVVRQDHAAATIDVTIDSATPFDPAVAPLMRGLFFAPNGELLPRPHLWGAKAEGLEGLRVLSADTYRCAYPTNGDVLGADLYFSHTLHSRPAIRLSRCVQVTLERVVIRSMSGMGIVGFRCRDVTLRGVEVAPCPGMAMSTNTDATHFACCSGVLRAEGCTLRGTGDDGLNVHSYYLALSDIRGRTATARLPSGCDLHALEPEFPEVGEDVAFVRRGTLEPVGRARVVASSATLPCRLELDRAIPDDVYLANLSCDPELVFRNNTVGDTPGRGLLVKCSRALVTGNRFFRTRCPGVLVAAEDSWGEGIVPQDVTISSNRFESCGWGVDAGHGTAIDVFVDSARRHERALIGRVVVAANESVGRRDGREPVVIRNVKEYVIK